MKSVRVRKPISYSLWPAENPDHKAGSETPFFGLIDDIEQRRA